ERDGKSQRGATHEPGCEHHQRRGQPCKGETLAGKRSGDCGPLLEKLPHRTIQRTGHPKVSAQRLADAGEKEADDVALIGMRILDGLDSIAAQAAVELPFIGAETWGTANQ